MDSIKMYSPNKESPCKIGPQNSEVSKRTIFQQFFRGKLETTMFKVNHQSIRRYCGVFDASVINAKRSTITTDKLTLKISVQKVEEIQTNVTSLLG